jgi:hypothetical protein
VTAAELDGARLIVPGQPEVWLMSFGFSHHRATPATFDSSKVRQVPAFALAVSHPGVDFRRLRNRPR